MGHGSFLCWVSDLLPMHERVECFGSHPFARKKANAAMRNQQELKAQALDCVCGTTEQLAEKVEFAYSGWEKHPSGAKARANIAALAARLKPCPFRTAAQQVFFRSL
jgi:hypothetical protein